MRCYSLKAFLCFIVLVPALTEARSDIPPAYKNKYCCVFPLKPSTLSHWYVDAGAGWVFNQKLGRSYLGNVGEPLDQYDPPKAKQVPMVFLSGGYVWSRQADWLPFTSVGLEYSYFFPAKAEGVIEEASDPTQVFSNYSYKVAHHTLYLLGKANLVRWRNWMPYVFGGLGASWNRFSAYSEESVSETPSIRPNPEFSNKAQSNFAYSLGTGLDYVFTKNLWGSLGYRYDHFGWGKTGDTNISEFADKNLKNFLKAHTLIFSLRYLFG